MYIITYYIYMYIYISICVIYIIHIMYIINYIYILLPLLPVSCSKLRRKPSTEPVLGCSWRTPGAPVG